MKLHDTISFSMVNEGYRFFMRLNRYSTFLHRDSGTGSSSLCRMGGIPTPNEDTVSIPFLFGDFLLTWQKQQSVIWSVDSRNRYMLFFPIRPVTKIVGRISATYMESSSFILILSYLDYFDWYKNSPASSLSFISHKWWRTTNVIPSKGQMHVHPTFSLNFMFLIIDHNSFQNGSLPDFITATYSIYHSTYSSMYQPY